MSDFLHTLFYSDPYVYYTLADAFTYAREQPPSGVFQSPYSWGFLAIGMMLAGLITYVVFSLPPLQKLYLEAEVRWYRRGRVLAMTVVMLFATVVWLMFSPLGNTSAEIVLVNTGATWFFVATTTILALSLFLSFVIKINDDEGTRLEDDNYDEKLVELSEKMTQANDSIERKINEDAR